MSKESYSMPAVNISEKSMLRITIPGLLGNVLEWYDFALYGYFAAVMSPLFFPTGNKTLSLITTFAVFALGFIMRPLGAIVFGHFGDRVGRKNSLAAAILLMAIPTTLIGCLPTYQQIGIIAPLLLLLFRLLQGLAVGGEFTGSIIYIIEHAPAKRRGFYGSLAMSSAFAGLILGSGVAALTGYITGDSELATWAWRIPFLVSILLGAIGLYLRMGMPESPVFQQMLSKVKPLKSPLKNALTNHFKQTLLAIGIVFLPSLGFYLSFVYLASYLTIYVKVHLTHALQINTFSMLFIMILIPFFGVLSDKIGRKKVMLIGASGFLLLFLPAYILLNHATTASIFIAQVIFASLVALSYAAVPAALVEMFPTNLRYTGMSFPYNVANALFGGTAPLMATTLIHFTNNIYAPAGYLMVCAIVAIFVIVKTKETHTTAL